MVVHKIDKSIVALYPRMLEIEQQKNMHLQSSYYFSNLNKNALRELSLKVDKPKDELEKMDYIEFRETVREKGESPQQILLDVWKELKFKSVTGRGHSIQNIIIAAIDVGFIVMILLGYSQGWW